MARNAFLRHSHSLCLCRVMFSMYYSRHVCHPCKCREKCTLSRGYHSQRPSPGNDVPSLDHQEKHNQKHQPDLFTAHTCCSIFIVLKWSTRVQDYSLVLQDNMYNYSPFFVPIGISLRFDNLSMDSQRIFHIRTSLRMYNMFIRIFPFLNLWETKCI